MDEDFNLWLIEVNTNPCLEESSEMLKHYLRRMVEDMIKLEIDPLFPRIKRKRGNEFKQEEQDLNQSNTEKKRRKSACLVPKKELKRKLSYTKLCASTNKYSSFKRRGFSKSSISKRQTCRSSNDDSFVPNKLQKSSNVHSLADLKNDTNSKNLSINSKEMEMSPGENRDIDNKRFNLFFAK